MSKVEGDSVLFHFGTRVPIWHYKIANQFQNEILKRGPVNQYFGGKYYA